MPPHEEVAPGPRYAYPVTTSAQPVSFSDKIFCETCQKNQFLYTEGLSNYLPDPDEPTYAKFLAAEPLYRRQLEDRYPQCCARCAPRVQEKLNHAVYTAKSDHMRRLLDSSKRAKIADRYGWRYLVVRCAGWVYVMSTIWHLTWHVETLSLAQIPVTKSSYLLLGMLQVTFHYLQPALFASLITIWWSPKWEHKIAGKIGRLRGLSEYFYAQFVLLVIRFTSWQLLGPDHELIPVTLQNPLHAVALMAEGILLAWSLIFAIHIDTTSYVNWQQEFKPLISERQFNPPPDTVDNPRSSARGSIRPSNEVFPIVQLIKSQAYDRQTWQPPLMVEDDPDRMDVDFEVPDLQLKPRPVHVPFVQESPFHGSIPTKPARAPLKSLPQNVPSSGQRSLGLAPGFFDKPALSSLSSDRHQQTTQPIFAPPKLQNVQRDRDTGLENIFGTVFSIQEERPIVPEIDMQDVKPQAALTSDALTRDSSAPTWSWWSRYYLSRVNLVFVLFNAAFVTFSTSFDYKFLRIRLFLLAFGLGLQVFRFIIALSSSYRPLPGLFGQILAICILTTLAVFTWSATQVNLTNVAASFMLLTIWSGANPLLTMNRPRHSSSTAVSSALQPPPPANTTPSDDSSAFLTAAPDATPSTPYPHFQSPDLFSTQLARPRTNSTTSLNSAFSTDTTVTSSTATGWKTPNLSSSQNRTFNDWPARAPSESPGHVSSSFSRLGLGLGVDDWSGVGNGIASARDRDVNRNWAGPGSGIGNGTTNGSRYGFRPGAPGVTRRR